MGAWGPQTARGTLTVSRRGHRCRLTIRVDLTACRRWRLSGLSAWASPSLPDLTALFGRKSLRKGVETPRQALGVEDPRTLFRALLQRRFVSSAPFIFDPLTYMTKDSRIFISHFGSHSRAALFCCSCCPSSGHWGRFLPASHPLTYSHQHTRIFSPSVLSDTRCL